MTGQRARMRATLLRLAGHCVGNARAARLAGDQAHAARFLARAAQRRIAARDLPK